jgi:CheY-like chemotaxis protein
MIPAIYYPTTVIFLDDDPNFLNTLKSSYKGNNTEFFLSPRQVYQYWETFAQDLFLDLKSRDLFDESARSVDFNMSSLKAKLQKESKEKNPTVFVVDYDMPEINGIDFCKRKEFKNVYKILLTGVAGIDKVVQAFNDGVIDAYISKVDSDYLEKLHFHIQKGKQRFFERFSQEFYKLLFVDNEDRTYISSPEFIIFFEKYIKENVISEYCITDSIGCFFMKRIGVEIGFSFYIADEPRVRAMVEFLPKDISERAKTLVRSGERMFCLDACDLEQVSSKSFYVSQKILPNLWCWTVPSNMVAIP